VIARLRVSSRAEADLVAAFYWYEDRMPGLGVDFIRCVDAVVTRIRHAPGIFRLRHGEYRLAPTPRFPYAIYFVWRENDQAVSVRRVLHYSQDAPRHLDR
jgi:plasmid stabilization system protein ParE